MPVGEKRTGMRGTGRDACEALEAGELVVGLGEVRRAAKEGLLAMSVAVGLKVMAEMMEEELTSRVGPKGPPNVSTRDVNWFGGGQSGRARAILLDRPSSSERGATPSGCRCDGYRDRKSGVRGKRVEFRRVLFRSM